eukprot:EG_transcript_26313
MAYKGPPGQDLGELFEVQQAPPADHNGFVDTVISTGRTKPRGQVHRDGDWHRSVHVWIVDPKHGTVVLQKRAPEKDTNPNKWDVGSAGHITAGDDSRGTAVREALEELGLVVADPAELEFLFTAVNTCSGETKHGPYQDNELQDIYLLVREGVDVDAIERNTEVCDVRAVPLLELRDQWLGGDPSYVPHARRYLERVFATLVDRFAS